MMLINDEKRRCFVDLELLRIRISDSIKTFQENIDDERTSPENRAFAYNALVEYQHQLDDILETEKIPFDVLVVVEKEK